MLPALFIYARCQKQYLTIATGIATDIMGGYGEA